jgi:hypothetical protein
MIALEGSASAPDEGSALQPSSCNRPSTTRPSGSRASAAHQEQTRFPRTCSASGSAASERHPASISPRQRSGPSGSAVTSRFTNSARCPSSTRQAGALEAQAPWPWLRPQRLHHSRVGAIPRGQPLSHGRQRLALALLLLDLHRSGFTRPPSRRASPAARPRPPTTTHCASPPRESTAHPKGPQRAAPTPSARTKRWISDYPSAHGFLVSDCVALTL